MPAGARTTGRLRRAGTAAVGDACRSVAEAADSFGVSCPTAHTAVVEAAELAAAEPAPTSVWASTRPAAAGPSLASVPSISVGCAPTPTTPASSTWPAEQGLLGQVEDRTSSCVIDWLQARTPAFRAAIRYVAIDPAAVYAEAIRAATITASYCCPTPPSS